MPVTMMSLVGAGLTAGVPVSWAKAGRASVQAMRRAELE
ncbi:hypothetical protein MGWOODY_Smn1738 [hydrothermal vent metagenome]|uniref:Uncharacterized protein n=1 Tax=hydrothermal vent metagenome TaxID=652676 RepID=A0A160TGK0_9ZZZZ